jgi:hypothetical protein
MNEYTSDYVPNTKETLVEFFDNKFQKRLEFATNDFDAVVGFFGKRGFEQVSSITLAQVLLSEAKKENIKIFALLDTIKSLSNLQLNALILKILNNSRDKTSQLGFRTKITQSQYEERNITDETSVNLEYSSLQFNSVYDTRNIRTGITNNNSITNNG